ncbi:type II toxin-antitoxin system RelB/DinJ family antitoxin [Levilactobacillus angrenensis]|uniref:Type II toxin-antitoxin system RelB/DinJ family antitoxin n=1 Tax=Levilactobacillus angrenensis TaxID=2486020 RepID=A0ABW1UCQ1_9LACO|nr:type II toxin-antitoxin system RelB/DinJ family antitoxin [Levilactobacillus angrenensis]
MTKVDNGPQSGHLELDLDPQLMQEVTQVYQKYGMSVTTAIHLFLQQSVSDQDLPFDVELSPEQFRAEIAREKAAGDSQSLAAVEALWPDCPDR